MTPLPMRLQIACFNWTRRENEMTQTQLLHEFGQLEVSQQLELLREALRLMQEKTLASSLPKSGAPTKTSLSEAATLLFEDYARDTELTSFTALDGEPVHAAK